MTTILLYVVLSTAFFYLGSRAIITSWLWSRYPPRLATFMDCAACSGAWYGTILGLTIGRSYDLPFLGLASNEWITPILVGLFTMVTTPILGGVMQHGFDSLGSVVEETKDSNG